MFKKTQRRDRDWRWGTKKVAFISNTLVTSRKCPEDSREKRKNVSKSTCQRKLLIQGGDAKQHNEPLPAYPLLAHLHCQISGKALEWS